MIDVVFISTFFHPYGNNNKSSHLCSALVYNKTLNSERTSVLRSYTTRSIHTSHREFGKGAVTSCLNDGDASSNSQTL